MSDNQEQGLDDLLLQCQDTVTRLKSKLYSVEATLRSAQKGSTQLKDTLIQTAINQLDEAYTILKGF